MKAKSATAARAQAARRQRGLTPAEVGVGMRARGHVKWTDSTMVSLENERKTSWTEQEMIDLAEILDVPLGYLWPRLTAAMRDAANGGALVLAAIAAVAPITHKRSTSPTPVGVSMLPPLTATTPLRAAA